MCLCRKRPCCRCIWKRCTFCAYNIFSIRVLLLLFCMIDIIIMLWYLYALEESRNSITNCCSVSNNNYPSPTINNTALISNYSTCSNLDYSNTIISSYLDIVAPFNHKPNLITNLRHYKWDKFKSIFTYYSINITIHRNGGCVYNDFDAYHDINCLSNTAMPCIQYINHSIANATNTALSALCQDNISEDEIAYIQFGILMIIISKILLIFISICCKVCRQEIRPEDEYIRNLLRPAYIPSFMQQRIEHKRRQTQALLHRLKRIDSTPNTDRRSEKSETIDMGAKSYYVYYRMEDRRKNRNICCKLMYAVCHLLELIVLFVIYLYKLIKWLIKTSFWIILLIINCICSMRLFFIYHSPVFGVDDVDFCTQQSQTCDIAQNQCGVVNWIILPHISKYLLPRYITIIFSLFACLGRCIERCAGFKLQELVAKKAVDIDGLNVNINIKRAFQRVSVTAHNENIASQFNVRSGDELVEDLSITNQSHIEMSNTESNPLHTSGSKQKRKKLFTSLDILEDHRSTLASALSSDDEEPELKAYAHKGKGGDSSLMDEMENGNGNNQVTDEEDDGYDVDIDMEQSQSRTLNKNDVLENDFYHSSDMADSKMNDNSKALIEQKHSLRGDLALFNQDRNRGDSGARRKLSL